jgi:hypothetical protein
MFVESLRRFQGYPKVRDLQKLLPGLGPFKITVILKYLVRTGIIVLDSDSNIIWTRPEESNAPTLGEVAEISDEVMRLLERQEE